MFSKLTRKKGTKLSRQRKASSSAPVSNVTRKAVEASPPKPNKSRIKKRGDSFLGNILKFDGRNKTARGFKPPDLSQFSFESINSDGNPKLEENPNNEEIRTRFKHCARATDIMAPDIFMSAKSRVSNSAISINSHHTESRREEGKDGSDEEHDAEQSDVKNERSHSIGSVYGNEKPDIGETPSPDEIENMKDDI